jgi:DNA end-binding protein Ku
MAASVWKGSISFGLVSVAIKLFAAARYSHISFHEVHRECGHRVQQQLYCPYDKRVVSRDESVMG